MANKFQSMKEARWEAHEAAFKFLQEVIEGKKDDFDSHQLRAAIELVGREPVRPEPPS